MLMNKTMYTMKRKAFILVLVFVANLVCTCIASSLLNNDFNKIHDNLLSLDESVDYTQSEKYDITLLAKLDYAQINTPNMQNLDDQQLQDYRTNVKNYYMAQNQTIAQQLNLAEYDYDISYYSPYI